MTHKVNPINFENTEGNLRPDRAMYNFLTDALTVSRRQRDLTDSTLLRNLGTALAHSIIGWQMTQRGAFILRLAPNVIERYLNNSWEVLGESIQVLMRKSSTPDAYEQLKELTKSRTLDAAEFTTLLKKLELPTADHKALASLTPQTYTGLAEPLAHASKKQ